MRDLGTGFSFRNYYFLILIVSLIKVNPPDSVYINIGYFISFIDRAFLKKRNPEAKISIIASPILIRNINNNYYFIKEYILLTIFLPGQ